VRKRWTWSRGVVAVVLAAVGIGMLPLPAEAAGTEPITVYFVNAQGSTSGASSFPEVGRAAGVAVDYINSHYKGVNGQKLQLEICGTLANADTSLQCANKAVDGGADVISIGSDTFANVSMPVYEKAGVPVTIQLGTNTINYTSPDSFSFVATSLGQLTGLAAFAKEQKFKRVAILMVDAPSVTSSYGELAPAVFKKAGIDLDIVKVPPTATDTTPYVSSAMENKPDAILSVQNTTQCAQDMRALQSIQANVAFLGQPACNDPSVLPLIPSGVKYYQTSVDVYPNQKDKDVALYTKLMKKSDPEDLDKGFAPAGFQGIMNLYRALAAAQAPAKGFDKTSITDALRSAKNVPNFMTGGSTFTCDGSASKDYPGACSTLLILKKLNPDGKTFKFVGSYNKPKLLGNAPATTVATTAPTTAPAG
jgi:branched-chain amino acid transport system substrate-binding protein